MLRSQQFRPNTSGHPAATAELGLVADDTKTGASFTWAESGMPNGLSLNSATGAITGMPTSAGTYSVTVTATGTPTTASTYLVTLTATDTSGSPGAAGFAWTITCAAGFATPDGQGYWLAGAGGGVFSVGDATFYGCGA